MELFYFLSLLRDNKDCRKFVITFVQRMVEAQLQEQHVIFLEELRKKDLEIKQLKSKLNEKNFANEPVAINTITSPTVITAIQY